MAFLFTLRPYLKVQYAGQEVTIRAVMELRLFQEKLKIDSADRNNVSKITCHDPSIFRDKDGTYYIVGSFLGGGSTKDLQNWTNLDTELQLGFSEETKEKIRAWNADSSAGSWSVEPDTGYITLTIDGQTYHGVTLEMNLENTTLSTQVFTALGVDNQLTLWGMKAIE